MAIALIVIGCLIAAWIIPAVIFGYALGGMFGEIGRWLKR